MQKRTNPTSKHYVIISDNCGASTLFPLLLKFLKSEHLEKCHISFLYFSEDDIFIFKEEIKILVKRFPETLIAYFKNGPEQACLETILNTNTKKQILFFLSIAEEWESEISNQLQYLGVERSAIFNTEENILINFNI